MSYQIVVSNDVYTTDRSRFPYPDEDEVGGSASIVPAKFTSKYTIEALSALPWLQKEPNYLVSVTGNSPKIITFKFN